MERLKGDIVSKVIEDLERKGRVTTLTAEQTSAIDNKLAEEYRKIREDCKIRERNSWIYLYKMEHEYRKPR
ncbi:MAG: hypothetical protein LBF59_07885 [Prevotellaceae bacterium]|jgi:hypothetical protein|nr:hypothetical protein [Prevotellaceae bacterium]